MATNVRRQPARSCLRPAPVAGISLTGRDVAVLTTAFLNPATRADQFQPLFPSVKTRNARLRLLFDHAYLRRSFPAASAFGTPIYHIGKAGVPIAVAALAERGLELSAEDIAGQIRRPSLSLLDHTLAIADVYSAVCLREPGPRVGIDQFYPERLVRFEYEVRSTSGKGAWRQQCFAPDGALVLSTAETKVLLFLEIDLATVPIARFVHKCRAFSHVATGGLTASLVESRLSALAVVTVSEVRLRRLVRAAEENGLSSVLFTTFGEIERAGLSAAWIVPGSGLPTTLPEFVSKGGAICSV